MEPRQPIIIAGNPVDGFEFYGPFEDEGTAADWADRVIRDREWWIAYLNGLGLFLDKPEFAP